MSFLKKVVEIFNRHGGDASKAMLDPDLLRAVKLEKVDHVLLDGRILIHDSETGTADVKEADGTLFACPAGSIKLQDGSTIDVSPRNEATQATEGQPEETKQATEGQPEQVKAATEYTMGESKILVGAVGEPVMVVGTDGATMIAPAGVHTVVDPTGQAVTIEVGEGGVLVAGPSAAMAALLKTQNERFEAQNKMLANLAAEIKKLNDQPASRETLPTTGDNNKAEVAPTQTDYFVNKLTQRPR